MRPSRHHWQRRDIAALASATLLLPARRSRQLFLRLEPGTGFFAANHARQLLAVTVAVSFVLCAISRCFGQGQINFGDRVGGSGPDTNSLSPVPASGLLLIAYDFLLLPDTLDVYYGPDHVFSSGPTSGAGQFAIPYGPGLSSSLEIVMNQDGGLASTVWQYHASVAVPEPGMLSLLGLGVFALAVGHSLKGSPGRCSPVRPIPRRID